MLQDALTVSRVFSSVPPTLHVQDMLLRVIFERHFVCVTFWLHAMTAVEHRSVLSCSMSVQICKTPQVYTCRSVVQQRVTSLDLVT